MRSDAIRSDTDYAVSKAEAEAPKEARESSESMGAISVGGLPRAIVWMAHRATHQAAVAAALWAPS